jgi:hypothetical protein
MTMEVSAFALAAGEEIPAESLTFAHWEFIVSKYFPKWELVTCGDDID